MFWFSRRSPIVCSEAELTLRLLPYGEWHFTDGRTVLFDRDYVGLYCRHPDGTVTEANPHEPIDPARWTRLYDSTMSPKVRRQRAEGALREWGVFGMKTDDEEAQYLR